MIFLISHLSSKYLQICGHIFEFDLNVWKLKSERRTAASLSAAKCDRQKSPFFVFFLFQLASVSTPHSLI